MIIFQEKNFMVTILSVKLNFPFVTMHSIGRIQSSEPQKGSCTDHFQVSICKV